MPCTRQPRRSRWETWLVVAIGAYFLARLLFFALTIAPGIPPDEETHVGRAELYARTLGFPGNSLESYKHGLVTHVPYLYHLLMGKLLLLNVAGLETHRFLRLANVALALATLLISWRLARALTDNALARVLFLVMLTNTLMLTFLSAAVSYDNLVIPLAVAALLATVRHLQSGDPRWLLGAALCVGLGALTKMTFLPLVPLLAAVWLFDRRGRLRDDWSRLASGLRAADRRLLALAGLVTLCLAANLHLYGLNLWRFGRPVPRCDQVLEVEQCLYNRIFARDWVVSRFREGETSFEQAVQETSRIPHAGDRQYARALLDEERRYRRMRPETLNRYEYVHMVWDRGLKPTLFGIQAHHSMVRTPNSLLGHNLVLLAAFVLVIRGLRLRGEDRHWAYLAFVVAGYFLVLVAFFNYSTYLRTHAPFLGVQGRYLFPVLVPAYLLAAEHLLRPFPRRAQIAVALVVSAVFVVGDLPYFREHATSGWYTPSRLESGSPP